MLPAVGPTGRPIARLSLVQLKVSPPPVFALKLMAATVAPEQTVTLLTGFTIGVGLMVMVKLVVLAPALVQEALVAVTVMVPVIAAPVLLAGAVYTIFPVPLKAIPINGLVFVQFMVAPATLLLSGMLTDAPAQKVWLATATTTGSGLTVTVKVNGAPEHEEELCGVMV